MPKVLKSCIILVMCLAIALTSACAKEPISMWNGEYQYEAYLGKTASQTHVIVNYILVLDNDNSCRLNIQGYQVDNQILCRTVTEGHDIHITFKSYADGALTNPYGIAVYQPDGKLFSLKKKDGEIVTTWHALKPDDNHTIGTHFKRAK